LLLECSKICPSSFEVVWNKVLVNLMILVQSVIDRRDCAVQYTPKKSVV
jgi:hypothetical protein